MKVCLEYYLHLQILNKPLVDVVTKAELVRPEKPIIPTITKLDNKKKVKAQ